MEVRTLGPVIGIRVRTLRAARNWTQADLSEALELVGLKWARSRIAELEAGQREDIPASALIQLAEVFNVPVVELVDREGAVLLGPAEHPLGLIARILAGEQPLDPGLTGPTTTVGGEPGRRYWVKPVGRSSRVYSELEVKAALQLGVFVQDVREASEKLWPPSPSQRAASMWEFPMDLELARRTTGSTWHEQTDMEVKLIDELGSSRLLAEALKARIEAR